MCPPSRLYNVNFHTCMKCWFYKTFLLNTGKYAYYLNRNQSKGLANQNNGCVFAKCHTELSGRDREREFGKCLQNPPALTLEYFCLNQGMLGSIYFIT